MYNPKIWYTGDIVTSGGLNNMEQGIAQNAHDIETINDSIDDLSTDTTELKNTLSDVKSELSYNGIGNYFDGVLYNGYWDGSGAIVDYSDLDVCNLNKIPCKEDDNIVIVANTSVEDLTYFISYLNDTTRIQRDTGTGTIYEGKAPAGAKYVCFTFEKRGIDKSTFGNVYAFVDNSIDKIKKDLASVHTDIGMVSTTFKMVTDHGHSSQLDRLYIPISAADKYYVKASLSTGQVISGAIYEIYTDGTSHIAQGSFYTETEYAYKASGDIAAIGVYINPPSTNCDAYVYVRTEGNLWTRLDNAVNNQKYKDEIIEQTVGIYANTFQMVSGSGHSSSLDQFNITIPKGSSYYIKAVASDGEVLPGQIYEIYSDGEYHLVSGSFYTGTEYKHTAEDNIYRIGLYIGAPSANITVSSYVKHEIDALNDQYILENYISTNNARHICNDAGVPLTLLHISDLHGDTGALKRITDYLSNYGTLVDDAICTGDMVPNTATAIESWWDSGVMTCIGNHDAASYDSSNGYDWDALSMADRVAYYISPFEANWDIVRESGKSYYYKDYTTQKVRLIVMDSQVYIANGADATAQNTWLTNLLSDAITNNMHVVIAIHAPKGGSPVEQCSFSKYGRTNMVELGDSFTPQAVVDIVESAITSGLHFVGYIVGHNHQDYIYKATDKQLGFCITCAAVAQKAQWTGSDQHRSGIEDAYNLVTIDTANTLVKIVRGGGADIDDHMRARKAICFNYSTGEKVGEVL